MCSFLPLKFKRDVEELERFQWRATKMVAHDLQIDHQKLGFVCLAKRNFRDDLLPSYSYLKMSCKGDKRQVIQEMMIAINSVLGCSGWVL